MASVAYRAKFEERYQDDALIEPSRGTYVFGKWTKNRYPES